MNQLQNIYHGVRHGESLANVEGIIVGDPRVGIHQYGLTQKGREQVFQSIAGIHGLDSAAVIVSSDFLRAAETAEIIREVLGVESVRFDLRLRERFFGEWEGAVHTNYSKAWRVDADDPDLATAGVESANAVRRRMTGLVQSLENEFSGRSILLVSHGDPLNLLQAAMLGVGASEHRSIPGFKKAEIRMLNPHS